HSGPHRHRGFPISANGRKTGHGKKPRSREATVRSQEAEKLRSREAKKLRRPENEDTKIWKVNTKSSDASPLTFLASRLLCFLASWLLGFLASWLLGFSAPRIYRCVR